MLVYKLDKEIPVQKLMNNINTLLSKEQDNTNNKLLCISIKHISHDSDSTIPKIGHKTLPHQ